jgi:hypothetical protein
MREVLPDVALEEFTRVSLLTRLLLRTTKGVSVHVML